MSVEGVRVSPRGKAVVVVASVLIGVGLVSPTLTTFNLFLASGLSLLALLTVLRYHLSLRIAALKSLRVDRRLEGLRVEGEALDVVLEVRNESIISMGHLELQDTPPRVFRLEQQPYAIVSLPARSTVRFRYRIRPIIGRHVFPELLITLRDPLGAYYYASKIPVKSTVRIRPRISRVASKVLMKTVSAPYGAAKFRRRGPGLEFSDVREYMPGDDIRRIDWKATARTGQLKTKEYELEAHLRILFVLDATETMMHGVIGNTKLEYSSRAVAFISKQLLERGDHVGLTIYRGAGLPPVHVPVRRGRAHFRRILDAISDISPGDRNKRRLGLAVQEAVARAEYKKGNLVLVISDLEFDDDISFKEFTQRLMAVRKSRNRIIIVSPYTPLFEVETLAGVGKIIYRIHAAKSWSSREEVVREFERLGIPVLNVGQEDVVEVLLNRLEEERRIAPA